MVQKFGTLPLEQARAIVSVGLLACRKDCFKVSALPVLQHGLNPSVMLPDWMRPNTV